MKLEVGKYYKAADGSRVGPLRLYEDRFFDVDGDFPEGSWLWREDGSGVGNVSLIAPWPADTDTGTLAELGVKVGDVVEWTDMEDGNEMEVIGAKRITDGKYKGQVNANLKGYGSGIFGSEQFRIISRASDGPVREVTLVRKEIVPGVYGAFWIGATWGDEAKATIGMRNSKDDTMHALGADELREAASNFIAVADAMEGE